MCVIFNFFWGDFLNVFLFVCIFSIELRVCVFFFLFSSFVDVFSIMIITIIILSTLSLSLTTLLSTGEALSIISAKCFAQSTDAS